MMRYIFKLVLVFLVMGCSRNPDPESIDVHSVKLSSGIISGSISKDEMVLKFAGIPFAAPPVGPLRWKNPQPVVPWDGVRDCVNNSPSAMQPTPKPFYCWTKEFMAPESPISEDCLYLNVWTTAETRKDKQPVMVWIHGGGFTSGSGTVPLYDGDAMSRKGVVFVTINYRLGIFGFLAHPELSDESDLHTSGNYGILDQIAALQWVRDNIEAFGGDPNNVTIAGQSAGAFSVNALVVSPLAKGLFHKAIAQSGGMFARNLSLGQTLQNAEEKGRQLTDNMNISSIDSMRIIPADSLLTFPGRWGLTVDEIVIPNTRKIFSSGRQNDVPLITGWNADDGVSFGPPETAEQFQKNARKQYGEKSSEFLELFPAGTEATAGTSQKLLSQLFFGWNNYSWARLQSSSGENPAYLYYFKRVPPGEPDYGAFHSAEFGYALHNLDKWDRPFTEVDRKLEGIMSDYWVNFAKTGDPNSEGLPEWPSFNNEHPRIIELGDTVRSGELPFKEQLRFLDQFN